MFSRYAPRNPRSDVVGEDVDEGYIVTPEELEEIRKPLLYPFFDGGPEGRGPSDYQENINIGVHKLRKDLNFLFPYYGFAFNYTWVSSS